jgi:DNA-damage-inducible protein J
MSNTGTMSMAKTGYVTARIEPNLKKEAESIFTALGVSTTEALTMFYRQVAMYKGLPFPVRIPNAETVAALQEARDFPERGTRYDSVSSMMTDLWKDEGIPK